MLSLTVISKKEYRRATWKNGLGHTDEIAIFPPGSSLVKGDFLWRLSSARIDQASSFSVFPEHDRALVILSGEGIRLFHKFDESSSDEEMIELPRFSAYEFPGDIQSRCELISGSVQDLSVFIRKGEGEVAVSTLEVQAGDPYPWILTSRWNFIFAARSAFSAVSPDGTALTVEQGDSLLVMPDQAMDVSEEQPLMIRSVQRDAQLITVGIQG